jgi:hypothetical protein
MPITITATPVPAEHAIRLEIAGAGTAGLTVEATPLGRAPYTVRPIGSAAPTDPYVLSDFAAPFGVPITYRVTAAGGSAQAIAQLDVSGCVLSSTRLPSIAAAVRVTRDDPHEWEARSAWFDVIGRPDPLVSTDVMRYRAGDLELYVRGNAARAELLELVTSGDPLLLRTSVPENVDDVILLPLNAREEPLVDNRGGRLFTIRYQAVTRPLGPYAGLAAWTYADLLQLVSTYDQLLDDFATYAILALGPVPVDASTSSSQRIAL